MPLILPKPQATPLTGKAIPKPPTFPKPSPQYQQTPAAMLGVIRKHGGALLSSLRQKEAEIKDTVGRKIKLIEKTGAKLSSILINIQLPP